MSLEEAVGFDVDVEIRNHNEGDDEKCGNQYACNDGRKVVQQFLKSQEVPRRLRRVRRVGWISDAFERSVKEKRASTSEIASSSIASAARKRTSGRVCTSLR